MKENTVFLNLDFMPPTAGVLSVLPEKIAAMKARKVLMRMIDNFPWSFDCRMQSDSAFSEQPAEYFLKGIIDRGIEVALQFPGPNDFNRLLRTKGYRRLAESDDNGFQIINREGLGFRSLIETIGEDVTGLVAGIEKFWLPEATDTEYAAAVSGCLKEQGLRVEVLSGKPVFITADQISENCGDNSLKIRHDKLLRAVAEASEAVFWLKHYAVMSVSGYIMPAAVGRNTAQIMQRARDNAAKAKAMLESFRFQAENRIDKDWMDVYSGSIIMSLNEDLEIAVNRLRHTGLLN